MSVDIAAKEQAVNNAIREISHIATLPEITMKIIQLVEDPHSTAQDLHQVISKDPALCTRILKVVNSAFYGLPGQIGSINRAIVLLGLNAVKNIAIAASLAKLFRGGSLSQGFSAKDLWMHSIAVGTANKMLADTLKLALADEAFLAGLIHDVGIMVMLQYDRNKLIEVIDKTCVNGADNPIDMMEVEQAVFGATHQDFGMGLCEKWKFPRSFAFVTGYHHRPLELQPEHRTLACMVFVADRLAAELSKGFRLDVRDNDIPQEVFDQLRLTHEQLDDIRKRLPEALAQVETMLAGA
jgi:HD-like signal output (HDOD) protein